jgi:hypothetical protein
MKSWEDIENELRSELKVMRRVRKALDLLPAEKRASVLRALIAYYAEADE